MDNKQFGTENPDAETYKLTKIRDLKESDVTKQKWFRGRVQKVINKGSLCFVILRQSMDTIQCVLKKEKEFIKYINSLKRETLIDIYGTIVKASVESTTMKDLEIQLLRLYSFDTPADLPFQIEDAQVTSGSEKNKERVTVGQDLKFDHRSFDLRTPVNQAIFRLRSLVMRLYRGFLYDNNFIEINTPKIIINSSEGGADMFAVNYFNKKAYLAQSPQLYKQMAVCGDFERVFEVGPVFRAEYSFTHRHLCEFIGMDIEMVIENNYSEIMLLLWRLLSFILKQLKRSEYLETIKKQYDYEEALIPDDPVILTFQEGIKLLSEKKIEQESLQDLTTANEKALGEIIKEKYKSDLFILHQYPTNARPFYTMLATDPNYTNSFDIIFKGEEIASGAQRVHQPEVLIKRIIEKKMSPGHFKDYIESFGYSSPKHGGAGFGLERIVSLFCGLGDVKRASMFPRDPKRCTP